MLAYTSNDCLLKTANHFLSHLVLSFRTIYIQSSSSEKDFEIYLPTSYISKINVICIKVNVISIKIVK